MGRLFETVTDLSAAADVIRRRRYGAIDIVDGQLAGVTLRPYPKIATVAEVLWQRWCYHPSARGNRCRLYYSQPWRFPGFLTLLSMVSTRDCSLATLNTALATLDEVARIKRSDALLCDAWNRRISARTLARYGWRPHKPSRWHRNYIKRFYGSYPAERVQAAQRSHETLEMSLSGGPAEPESPLGFLAFSGMVDNRGVGRDVGASPSENCS